MNEIQKAREQSQKIIDQAQQQAKAIVGQARTQADKLRRIELARRAKNRERAERITAQARAIRANAVRMFRINLANTLTLFNGVCGFLSMLASIQREFALAALFIIIGVLFDWLDGKAARAFGEESPLGKELDSLSDLITFGVAPAILVAMISPSFLAFGAGALFVFSAALRLGRFNVQQTQGVFYGVPTTTNGILLPLMIFTHVPAVAFPWFLLAMAFLMNAPIQIKKVF